MKRDLKIDALKGCAIILVVLGHCIQSSVTDFDDNLLFRFIYSFHMPLFMFLSGYLAWNRDTHLLKKFQALAVPFLSWYVLEYMAFSANRSVAFSEYMLGLFTMPDRGLWFLWVLFIIFCIFYIVQRVSIVAGDKKGLITFLLVYFAVQQLPDGMFGLWFVKWHLTFFGAGYYFAKFRNIVLRYGYGKIIFLLIFPLLALTWHRTHAPSFQPVLMNVFTTYGIPGSFVIFLMYKYLVPFFGIGFAFSIVPETEGVITRYLCLLGTITLDIYAVHHTLLFNPDWSIGIGRGGVKIATAFILALTVSVAVSTLLRKSKMLSLVFLGTNLRPVRPTVPVSPT